MSVGDLDSAGSCYQCGQGTCEATGGWRVPCPEFQRGEVCVGDHRWVCGGCGQDEEQRQEAQRMERETRSTPDPSQSCPRCRRVVATSQMVTLSKPVNVFTGSGYKATDWVCRDCHAEVED